MNRGIRVLGVVTLLVVTTQSVLAGVPGPELDPGSIGSGLIVLGVGAMYLIERWRRRT